MNLLFYILTLLLPLILLTYMKYKLNKKLTLFEVIFGIFFFTSAATGIYYSNVNHQLYDYHVLNGEITKKVRREVPCEHSYRCNCRTQGGTERCHTCYKHSHDWDWVLLTTAGEAKVYRIDSRGLRTPPNWKKAYLSEPATIFKPFTNYVNANPAYIFDHEKYNADKHFDDMIPSYPLYFQNDYAYNHIISINHDIQELPEWNQRLAEMLKTLGPLKQVNILIVIVDVADPDYKYALEKAWLRGKPHDVIIVIGSTHLPAIDWLDIISWSPSTEFRNDLRQELNALKNLDIDSVLTAAKKHILASYQPFNMDEYKFLLWYTKLEPYTIIVVLIIVIAGPIIFMRIATRKNITPFMFIIFTAMIIIMLASIHNILPFIFLPVLLIFGIRYIPKILNREI